MEEMTFELDFEQICGDEWEAIPGRGNSINKGTETRKHKCKSHMTSLEQRGYVVSKGDKDAKSK